MSGQKRRTGRPTKPAAPGDRMSLGLKVTANVKKALDAAAQATGRTQSQEAELRLENSFHEDERPGGPEAYAVTLVMLAAFVHSGQMEARDLGHPEWTTAQWMADPDCFERAALGAVTALWTLDPKPDWDTRKRFLLSLDHRLLGQFMKLSPAKPEGEV
jgi:hypothetical protein